MGEKLTTDDVRRILDILDASQFDELQLETGDFKLVLRRSSAPDVYVTAPAPEGTAPVARPVPEPPTAASDLATVKAPMLGVFYRAPKPGAAAFVEVGSKVEPDTVVGIVEVMKLMHSVAAGMSGEVVEIVAANGEMVEFDQTLLRLRRH